MICAAIQSDYNFVRATKLLEHLQSSEITGVLNPDNKNRTKRVTPIFQAIYHHNSIEQCCSNRNKC